MKANLDILKLELFLRLRNDGKIVWKTKEGKVIPIKNMTDKHLINTINMLEGQQAFEDECNEALSSIGDREFY